MGMSVPGSSASLPSEDAFYKMMQAFPKHDTIRLRSNNFVQWQYQLKLLLDAYELIGFVDETMKEP